MTGELQKLALDDVALTCTAATHSSPSRADPSLSIS
jgi:hypothetical protein